MALPVPQLARLSRLGGWPRRVAALCCLLLAAASAVSARHAPPGGTRAPAGDANPLASRLGRGQVAAPVTLTGAGNAGYLRAGDRIDLYASPGDSTACAGLGGAAPVGAALPVLAVSGAPHPIEGGGQLGVVVAVDHATAARLATLQTCGMFAVLDKYP